MMPVEITTYVFGVGDAGSQPCADARRSQAQEDRKLKKEKRGIS